MDCSNEATCQIALAVKEHCQQCLTARVQVVSGDIVDYIVACPGKTHSKPCSFTKLELMND